MRLADLPYEREAAAETVSDWVLFLDQGAGAVTRSLVTAAGVEIAERVRKGQLHAIFEVSASVKIGRQSIVPLH